MTININNGEIKFDQGGLAIRPELKKDTFLSTGVGCNAQRGVTNQQFATYHASIESGADKFGLSLIFEGQRLDTVRLSKFDSRRLTSEWSDAKEHEIKLENDRLLAAMLGQPPYHFAWGEIASLFDPRSGSAHITVWYLPKSVFENS